MTRPVKTGPGGVATGALAEPGWWGVTAYLDKPTNPKEARFSERAYGRIGSYFEYEVTEKKPLKVDYRIWLQNKQMTVAEGAALDDDFVNPVKVTVK